MTVLRSAVRLVRTSLPATVLLAASLFALANVLFDDGDGLPSDPAGAIPSLAPLPKPGPTDGGEAVLLQRALFDPGNRPETIAGSIDDLRSGEKPMTAGLTIAGVLLSGETRKAMLSLGGGAPSWSGVGDERGGWRIAQIDADGAVLERDGRSVVLKVADRYKQRGKQPPDGGATAAMPEAQGGGAVPPNDLSPPDP